MKVGFIGLGIMGRPMAGHLAAKGHHVTVYNRSPARATAWTVPAPPWWMAATARGRTMWWATDSLTMTSPPIAAICRTKVAVIGRTAGDAGRNTVWTSGAMAPFMPAICIS